MSLPDDRPAALPTPHDAPNQPPPLVDLDLYAGDRALVEALRREGGGWGEERVQGFGRLVGRAETIALGCEANAHPPVLRTHDRAGHRIDEVAFHPAWHALLRLGVEHGLHALPWREPRAGAHVVRGALFFLLAEIEAGVGCPLSMTYSGVAALRAVPRWSGEDAGEWLGGWEQRLTAAAYDPRPLPADHKAGALCGMAMTEKQGGSDVRANTTRAVPLSAPGTAYELTGHKWFCSAPMCDAFFVLAQAPGGLTCFLLPRFTPGGERNGFHLQRLKDKLGNRSNASSEVELRAAWARRIGEEGRGVATILEMVMHTRLDCVLGSAAGMRRAAALALHHAAHRRAFGKRLLAQPLMQNVLADLALESEAATAAALRLARSYDEAAAGDPGAAAFRRLATAVLKYWVTKRAAPHAAEALECLGGNGYVEEWGLARLYREAPLNSIWEGAGNVQCLDVLRAAARSPEAVDAVRAELALAAGADRRYDAWVKGLESALAALGSASSPAPSNTEAEAGARRLAERLALALQASLLVRHAPPAVADAFCAARLGGDGGLAFGTLPPGLDLPAIVERALPDGASPAPGSG